MIRYQSTNKSTKRTELQKLMIEHTRNRKKILTIQTI